MAGWTALSLKKKVPISGRHALVANPLVLDDAIYATDHWDGDIVKLDRRHNLRELWRTASQGQDPAALYGKTLLAHGVESSALDVETGRRLWTRESRYGIYDWKGKPILKHENRPFEIIDPTTGETLEVLDVPRTAPEALCGDVIIFRTEYGNDPICAFSLKERRVLWERRIYAEIQPLVDPRSVTMRQDEWKPLPSFVPGSPGRFVMTCGAETFGGSLEDGSILWRAPVGVPYNWPNVHQGTVYVLSVDHFIAIDEVTGIVVYDIAHRELAGDVTTSGAIRARPGTVYGDTIAFANESGHLAVFNRRDGRLVWLYRYKAALWGTAEADGRLLVSTGDGKLLVFAEKAAT